MVIFQTEKTVDLVFVLKEFQPFVGPWVFRVSVNVAVRMTIVAHKAYGLSSREKIGLFIILIDSLYLQESMVQKEKFEKKIIPLKRSKTVKIFG